MPSNRLAPLLVVAALIAASTADAAAQAAPTVDLNKRTAKSKYTLGQLLTVQELPDGRVVATDSKEGVFRMVDLAKGEVGLVGKQGDDSDTYRRASAIFRYAGDSLGLYDSQGRKIMHLSAQGTVTGFAPLPTMSNNRRFFTPVGGDATGALFYMLPAEFDSVAKASKPEAMMTRVAAGATTDQPLMMVHTRRADQKQTGLMPIVFRDAIAVRQDGLVARVAADTYQVIWSRDGKEIGRTGPLAYTPIPITEAEQQAIKDSIIGGMKSMMAGGRGSNAGLPPGVSVNTSGNGGGATSAGFTVGAGGGTGGTPTFTVSGGGGGGGSSVVVNGTPVDMAAVERARAAGQAAGQTSALNGPGMTTMTGNMDPSKIPFSAFPEAHPPIQSSANAAMFDANGLLWVARERAHGDAIPKYDVIAEGKGVVMQVKLPAGTRLVGFGKGVVYLARDEEGSDWLERYAMPKM